jgi:flagellar basal body-associated protein FliL
MDMASNDQSNPPPKGRNLSWVWYAVPAVVFVLVVTVWVGYWFKGQSIVPGINVSEKGQFGDMFGALNTFFSALAFAAIFFTVVIQIKQLRDQQEELQRTEQLQRQSAQALQKQAESNELSTKLSALDSLIQAISRQIEHCKENSPEHHFLKLELDGAIGDLRNLIKAQNVFSGLPDSSVNDVPLTHDDIVELFPKYLPYFSADEIRPQVAGVYSRLLRFGVNTRRRLESVLRSQNVIRQIENLYLEELFRPPTKPLDPGAVATWVVMLFADNNYAKLNEIRNILRTSPEWNEKARSEYPPFHYLGVDVDSKRQPVIVIFPVKGPQPFPHFNKAREVATDWVKQNQTSTTKPKIFYFDFDRKWWEEATKW